jgi:preprotein translocase subunit SecD
VINLWFGRRKKLTSVSIGQIWKPDTTGAAAEASELAVSTKTTN